MSKQLVSKLSQKSQVTVPLEVRRRLGLRPHDTLAFIISDDSVTIQRSESVVSRTSSIIRSPYPPLGAEEEQAAFDTAFEEEARRENAGG